MSIGDSMKKLIGIEELDEITEEEVNAAKDQLTKQAPMRSAAKEVPQAAPAPAPERHQTPPMTSSSPARGERRFTVTSTNAFKLVLLEPKTFEECPKLVDSLKSRKPVIINLEKLETETARKIFDFLSGATSALNGNDQKVANNIFIFAPENVDIAGGISEDRSGPEFPTDDRATMKADNPWRK